MLKEMVKSDHCNIEIIDRSIRNGDDLDQTDEKGQTALHHASSLNKYSIVEKLVTAAKVNVPDNDGNTALDLSGSSKVRQLLEKNGGISLKNIDFEVFLLHNAVETNNLESVKEAILVAELDPNLVSSVDAITPLHLAVAKGNLEIVEFLIDNGADVNARDVNSNTPLHVSAANRDYNISSLLVQNGANPRSKNRYDVIPYSLYSHLGNGIIAEGEAAENIALSPIEHQDSPSSKDESLESSNGSSASLEIEDLVDAGRAPSESSSQELLQRPSSDSPSFQRSEPITGSEGLEALASAAQNQGRVIPNPIHRTPIVSRPTRPRKCCTIL